MRARDGDIKVSGDNGWREPPVPIPNTEVKPPNADGTELGTAWESRKSPGSKAGAGETEVFPALAMNAGEMAERPANVARDGKPRRAARNGGRKERKRSRAERSKRSEAK